MNKMTLAAAGILIGASFMAGCKKNDARMGNNNVPVSTTYNANGTMTAGTTDYSVGGGTRSTMPPAGSQSNVRPGAENSNADSTTGTGAGSRSTSGSR